MKRFSAWLPPITSLVLGALILYNASEVFLSRNGGTTQTAPADGSAVGSGPPTRAKASDLARGIASAHLFGSPKQAAAIEAPETRLNLTLLGVMASDDPHYSFAIISQGKGKENLYTLNDRIPGNATLKQVHIDRVILERNNNFETLSLPSSKDRGPKGARAPATAKKTPAPGRRPRERRPTDAEAAKTLGNYRKQLIKNPQLLGKLARVEPAKQNGSFQGFRLQSISDRELQRFLDVQPNDVITAVNGVALDSQLKGLLVARKLLKADRIDLTVLRNGQEVKISRPIN